MTTAVGAYCTGVGLLILGWWGVLVARGTLAQPDRSPVEIRLHLATELLTAGLLIAGGVAALSVGWRHLTLVGLGMLLYSVGNSPGYFVHRHETGPAVLFIALFVLTGAAIGMVA